ncbi:MAG: phage tail sheath family protein [Candidatus Hodarchaeota archaeon]
MHPGVYIEEVPSGVRPIEGVSTSTAAFIGKTEMGTLNEAVLVTGMQEFEIKYGTYLSDSRLAHAVLQFFRNGGKKCYIIRVAGTGARAADIVIRDRKTNAPAPTLTIRAANEGIWGNRVDVGISNSGEDPANEFNIEVLRDRSDVVPPLSPELLETHSNLSMNPAANNYVEKVVAENSKYIAVEVDTNNLADAAFGNASGELTLGIANGGTESMGAAGTAGTSVSAVSPSTALPANRRRIVINLDGDGPRDIQIAGAANTGNAIAGEIRTAVQNLTANNATNQPAYDSFTCEYDTSGGVGNEVYRLTSGTTGTSSTVVVTDAIDVVGTSRSGVLPVGNGAVQLNLGTANGGTENVGVTGPPPTAGTSQSGPTPSTDPPADQRRFMINLDDDGLQAVSIPVTAASGAEIAAAIQAAVQNLTPNQAINQAAYDGFTCTYETGNAADRLNLGVAHGGEETAGVAGPPATAGTSVSGANPDTNLPPDNRKIVINLDGDGPREVQIPLLAATGAEIADAIQAAVRSLVANNVANQTAYDSFTCEYDISGGVGNEVYRLTSGTTGTTSTVVVTDAPPNPTYLLTSGTTGLNSTVVVTNWADPVTGLSNPISLDAGNWRFTIEVNGDGPHVVTLVGPLPNGAAIATAIQNAVQGITPKRSVNAAAFVNFRCTYQNTSDAGNPSLLLASGTFGVNTSVRVTNGPGAENVAGRLRLGLTNRGIEVTGAAILRPANSQDPTEYHLGDALVGGNVVRVTFGADGNIPGQQDYINAVTVGQSPLDTVRDVSILCIPGIGDAVVVATGTNYCTQRMDCFFIGDVNQTDDTVKEAQDFVNSLTVKSSYGAIYYPWIKIIDPTGKSPDPIAVPPSGFVAGMYARIDARRGVWKGPGGTEANIGGAVGLVTDTTDVEQDFLNPIGVNVIRSFPASGLVIWGVRTLATRSDPEYRYISVRRTAIFLEQSIYTGIQWAVFEPNDEDLWASLRLNIGAFIMLQFRAGAFQGQTPSEAFFVKCDDQTTTQADIDAGIVNILVGFAPLKPAEFVVLKLSQKAGQSAT